MPSLLDLTSQGDVGTISDESKLSSVTLMTPQQLYELWERQNWQSHAIDFSQDQRDWASMDPELREQLSWNLSSFFVGEERVTTQFSGLVMSYENQGEEDAQSNFNGERQHWVGHTIVSSARNTRLRVGFLAGLVLRDGRTRPGNLLGHGWGRRFPPLQL